MTRKTLVDADSTSGIDTARPRWKLYRSWRMGALAAVAALGLAACVNNDASRSDVVNALTDADVPPAEAECVGDAFVGEQGSDGLARIQEAQEGFTGFNQEQLNDIADAEDQQELQELQEFEVVDEILTVCRDGETGDGGGDDAATTDDTGEAPEGEGDEDTTTTEEDAEG